jgi:hypothetical protein
VKGTSFARLTGILVAARHLGRVAGESASGLVKARVADHDASRRDGLECAALRRDIAPKDAAINDELAFRYRGDGAALRLT